MSHDDSAFMRTFWGVIIGLTVLMFVIIVLARWVSGDQAADPANDPRVLAKIEERIKPVGQVRTGNVPTATASSGGAVDAKGTYTSACFACHGTGAAGAPKLGDKAGWKARIAKGNATLYKNAIKGFKGMPPKGGRSDLSDGVVKAIVDYMVAESK
ncbi:MAG: c-type cytochrome [Gammaproteobacteria bacterium]|nr:c-type cytochrome [Gammaproteobacteria bacterium]